MSDGIVLEGNGEKISLVPIPSEVYSESLTVNGASLATEPTVHKTDDKTVTYTIGTKTSINYSLTYTGFKEDIIVSEYTGQTEYDFVLNTNGLTLEETNGSFRLVDENNIVKATLGDIIVFTADNANNTMGEMTARTVKANEKYILTVKVDDDYLKDAKTKYPITIDPTVEICYDNNGAGAISDVTLNSLDDCSPDSGALFVGLRQTYGISRILMKFPGLSLSSLGSNINITNAIVEMRDLMCEDSDLTVYCHPFTGNTWTESTVDWTNVNPDSYGTYSSSKVISYTNGNALDPKYRYSFDITAIAKGWKNGTYDINKGIIFKASNSVETGSTYSSRTFASYNRATNKPSLSVTYESTIVRSPFYSKYDPDKYNDGKKSDDDYEVFDSIQYRMNCYGYVLGFIYDGSATSDGYLQQPGEFAATEDKCKTVYNLQGAVDNCSDSPIYIMNNVVSNMELDMKRLGYTMTEYVPTSSTIAQYGTTSRLIAIATGMVDYHFYMQHNDGTWSHKLGSEPVTNKSIDSEIVLTNSNIQSLANEEIYANGELKFFIITKPAIIDYPHGNSCCQFDYDWPCSHSQNSLNLREQAGEYFQTATLKQVGTTDAKFDFPNDTDVYYFVPTTTRNYTVSTTCSSGAEVEGFLYGSCGELLQSDTYTGQINYTKKFVAGETYYFVIFNCDNTVVNYTFSIT